MPVETTIEGGLAFVVINRPEAMNAVSPEVLAELHVALDEIEDSGARVCILSGAGGRAFSAGADLAEMLALTPDAARDLLQQGVRFTRRLETGPFVSIAAINGYALGGGAEIMLACSLRFAAPDAKIGLPEVTVGIFPGWGGIVRLPRQAPYAVARDMILSGRILDASETLAAGLIEAIVDDPVAVAREAGERLLRAGPDAQRLARTVLQETDGLDLDAALALATERWLTLMGSEQRIEGHRAFIERRPPDWEPS